MSAYSITVVVFLVQLHFSANVVIQSEFRDYFQEVKTVRPDPKINVHFIDHTRGRGGGGVLLGILGRGVPPGSPNLYPFSDQNGSVKNHTLWGGTYLYSLYRGVPTPPPPPGDHARKCMITLLYFPAWPLDTRTRESTLRISRVRALGDSLISREISKASGHPYSKLTLSYLVCQRYGQNVFIYTINKRRRCRQPWCKMK